MPLSPEARQAYIKKVQAQLDQYDAQLSEMKARADKVAANAKVEYHSMMEEAIVKRDALQVQLGELQSSSESAWEEIQKGLEKAGAELQKSFGAALEKFK